MFRSAILGAACAASIYGAATASAQPLDRDGWAEAFDRRGYRVGMTLLEARAISPPDALPPGRQARFACSNEHGFRVARGRPTSAAARAGLTICVTVLLEPDGSLSDIDWSPQLLDFGTTTRFHFARLEGEPEPLLMLISTRDIRSADFARVAAAYRAQLGEPSSTTHPTLQTRAGGRLQTTVLLWENRVSYLQLRQFDDTVDWSGIEIVHTPIAARFRLQLDRARAEEARGRL